MRGLVADLSWIGQCQHCRAGFRILKLPWRPRRRKSGGPPAQGTRWSCCWCQGWTHGDPWLQNIHGWEEFLGTLSNTALHSVVNMIRGLGWLDASLQLWQPFLGVEGNPRTGSFPSCFVDRGAAPKYYPWPQDENHEAVHREMHASCCVFWVWLAFQNLSNLRIFLGILAWFTSCSASGICARGNLGGLTHRLIAIDRHTLYMHRCMYMQRRGVRIGVKKTGTNTPPHSSHNMLLSTGRRILNSMA